MNLLEPIWNRPKGTHNKTYQRLRREAAKAEQASWADLLAGIVPRSCAYWMVASS